jgi:hypothetical protein
MHNGNISDVIFCLNGKALQSHSSLLKKQIRSQERGFIPIIPATWEVEVEASRFEASPGRVSTGPDLKNKL